MNENEIVLDSSSDESIVAEQAKKLFNICDSDEKGFINQNDLIRLNEFASMNDILEIQRMCKESNAERITKEHFTEIIKDLVNRQAKVCDPSIQDDAPLHEFTMNYVLHPNDISLASELASMQKAPPYHDTFAEELRQQLAEQESKPKQDLETIYEHPVKIKRPQFRPMEMDLDRISPISQRGSPQSLADELNEVERKQERRASCDEDLRTPDRIFKVVFVGDSAVGKTCFLHRFCYNRFKPLFSATIGVDFTVKTICVGNRVVALQLWDTAGQERFRSITKQYFRKADGVLLLFDVTSEQSFLNVRNWIESVRLGVDETTIMALVGNKVDLFGNESTRNTVFRAGKMLAEEFNMPFYETSAYTGYGIDHCMRSMAERLQKREEQQLHDALRLEMEP
ncbi:hypothetical protein Angca_003567, partial [Angiostrongylus cantonensis]